LTIFYGLVGNKSEPPKFLAIRPLKSIGFIQNSDNHKLPPFFPSIRQVLTI